MASKSAPVPIPFKTSTILHWQMIQAEHRRTVTAFFLTVMGEQGLDPNQWSPNVTTMQYEPIVLRPAPPASARPVALLVDDVQAELKKRAKKRTGDATR